MVNLAGVKECDTIIIGELTQAGIFIVQEDKTACEVAASVTGRLNKFEFTRAWNYWVVKGFMPLEYAKELYEKYKDLNIRADGHCGNPPPEEWAFPKRQELDRQIEELGITDRTYGNLTKLCNNGTIKGDRFVSEYHVDSQEGLNKLAAFIKQYNITGE